MGGWPGTKNKSINPTTKKDFWPPGAKIPLKYQNLSKNDSHFCYYFACEMTNGPVRAKFEKSHKDKKIIITQIINDCKSSINLNPYMPFSELSVTSKVENDVKVI